MIIWIHLRKFRLKSNICCVEPNPRWSPQITDLSQHKTRQFYRYWATFSGWESSTTHTLRTKHILQHDEVVQQIFKVINSYKQRIFMPESSWYPLDLPNLPNQDNSLAFGLNPIFHLFKWKIFDIFLKRKHQIIFGC